MWTRLVEIVHEIGSPSHTQCGIPYTDVDHYAAREFKHNIPMDERCKDCWRD